eukprot:14410374-Alexandrium_andersonii.AAC.1
MRGVAVTPREVSGTLAGSEGGDEEHREEKEHAARGRSGPPRHAGETRTTAEPNAHAPHTRGEVERRVALQRVLP